MARCLVCGDYFNLLLHDAKQLLHVTPHMYKLLYPKPSKIHTLCRYAF